MEAATLSRRLYVNKFIPLREFPSVPSSARTFYLVGFGDGVIVSAALVLVYVLVF